MNPEKEKILNLLISEDERNVALAIQLNQGLKVFPRLERLRRKRTGKARMQYLFNDYSKKLKDGRVKLTYQLLFWGFTGVKPKFPTSDGMVAVNFRILEALGYVFCDGYGLNGFGLSEWKTYCRNPKCRPYVVFNCFNTPIKSRLAEYKRNPADYHLGGNDLPF